MTSKRMNEKTRDLKKAMKKVERVMYKWLGKCIAIVTHTST
jgi:hypothetical protein